MCQPTHIGCMAAPEPSLGHDEKGDIRNIKVTDVGLRSPFSDIVNGDQQSRENGSR